MTGVFAMTPGVDDSIGHVRAVLPDRVLDDARVVVRDGLIVEVGAHPAGRRADLDGAGLLCLPGAVDVHSDGLEREVLPRPGARLPWGFAVAAFEARLLAAGVTTVFHGAAFEEPTGFEEPGPAGVHRSVASARELCAAVAAHGTGQVDQRILHRLDVRSAEGLAALQEQITAVPAPLVSAEDHTPGQGQYADPRQYETYVAGTRGLDARTARGHVDRLVAHRGGLLDAREKALQWLGAMARAGRLRLLGHDPVDADDIHALIGRGGIAAEFPTTLVAAQAARDRDLMVVAGAPNVLRGGSHAGNVDARELAGRGLLTALASDYLPAALLPAALRLAASGLLTLPAAVALVTAGPARVAGLDDRGALRAGLRADLVLVDPTPWPTVRATFGTG